MKNDDAPYSPDYYEGCDKKKEVEQEEEPEPEPVPLEEIDEDVGEVIKKGATSINGVMSLVIAVLHLILY